MKPSSSISNFAERLLAAAGALALAGACAGSPQTQGLSVVAPTSLGEGHGDPHPARPGAPGAVASAAPSSSPPTTGTVVKPPDPLVTGSPTNQSAAAQPDPPPLVTAHQWDLTLHYAKGKVSLQSARPVDLVKAIPTPRRMGRFAVELWIGKELVDRVRFEFPLLGADFAPSPGTKLQERGAPRFSTGADTVATVRVPANDRATSAQVVDRLTGAVVSIPWPPEPAAPAASAALPASSAPSPSSPSP
ncbi:MAG TPA: hypothetical protein VHC69_05340 [Polyangiaceae bacterium]|nr:hypothetical protein [Polyangiaceae bacterium]